MAVIRYFLSSAGAIMPVGEEFVLLYDGTGIIELEGVSNSNTSPGRISFASAGDGSVWLNLVESEASDPIHNIRIVRPQHEFDDLLSEPFYEGFIDKIDPFNTLRFMDWGNTNNNPISQWNNRTLPTYRTYATNTGVPYEIMIQLANTLQQDVWLCIPHAADNDYINQLATLFATELDPNLTIYLEYSNEVWNWIFEQAHYNLENGPDHLNYGRIYAERAKNTFVIWHNIFGLTEQHRVKRVLGIQATFTYLNEQILAHLSPNDWDYGLSLIHI